MPHPHSTAPLRSPPRTADDPQSALLAAVLAIAKRLALTDPNTAFACSSQPPLSKCCDDRLNLPARRDRCGERGRFPGRATIVERLLQSVEDEASIGRAGNLCNDN
jgi:hypothetical protein